MPDNSNHLYSQIRIRNRSSAQILDKPVLVKELIGISEQLRAMDEVQMILEAHLGRIHTLLITISIL